MQDSIVLQFAQSNFTGFKKAKFQERMGCKVTGVRIYYYFYLLLQ